MENVNQFAESRKWRFWRSKSTVNKQLICKSLLGCPTITAPVAAFDAKAFNDTELWKLCLAGWSNY